MIKQAIAVALMGTGLACLAPAHAAPALSGGAAASMRIADDTVVKVVGPCLELPVALNVTAFFELLMDEEMDRHCDDWRWDSRRHEERPRYEERGHPTYKDGGHEPPRDLKAEPR